MTFARPLRASAAAAALLAPASVLPAAVLPAALFAVAAPAALFALAAPAAGQTAVELAPITVFGAARDARDVLDTPAAATVIGRAEIDARAASTFEDLLGDVPGVSIGGGPRGISQEPNIRGFADEQVVIRADGVRQTFNLAHRGRFFLDPEILRSVEIVRGGGSTLFGSGALGGVIGLETLDAADVLAPGAALGGRLTLGAASQGREGLGALTLAARAGRFDALAFVSHRPMTEDLTDGRGDDIANSAVDSTTGLVKLGLAPAEGARLEASWSLYTDEGDVPPNANAAATPANVVARELTQQTGRLGFDWAPPGSDLIDLSALAYVNRVEVSERRFSDGRLDDTTSTTLGFDLSNVSRVDLGRPVTFAYGIEAYTDSQEAERAGAPRVSTPDADLTFLALYAQAEVELTETLALIPGLRWDRWSTAPDDPAFADREEDALSPRLALNWRPAPGVQLFGSVSQSFRAPSATELYVSGVHFSTPGFPLGPGAPTFTGNNEFVPNPDLEPELALQGEIGGRWETGGLLSADDRLSLSGSVYAAQVDDYIDNVVTFIDPATTRFDPMRGLIVDGTTRTRNIDAQLWGFEAAGRYRQPGWYAGFGLSIPRGRAEAGGALGSIPQDTLTLSAGLTPLDGLDLGLRATLRAGQNDVPAGGSGTGGSGVLDLFASWSPTEGPLARARVSAGIDNVLDKTYRIHPNGLSQPGRSFKLRVGLDF